MIAVLRFGVIISAALSLVACSSTEKVGSWANRDFQGKIEKVYVIGVAENETNRRIFEDTFSQSLVAKGVKNVASYVSLPASKKTDKDAIEQHMIETGCDSVLITQLVGQRTETVVNPGQISGYSSGPYAARGGYGRRDNYYGRWDNYYGRSQTVTYMPATTSEFVILTVESILFDLQTSEMIWSAQFETFVEGTTEKMMQDFVKEAIKDLSGKGII